MVDAVAAGVAAVEKIVGIAFVITNAVETVKENKEECHGIEKLVRRVSNLLSRLKTTRMMSFHEVVGPLEDLGDSVSRARDVVMACQGRNILCLFCKAGRLAKKLSKVKSDIKCQMMLAIFATQATNVFLPPQAQLSVLMVNNVFYARTYRQPPMPQHLPSPPPVFVEDIQPGLPTHEAPRSSTPPPHRPPIVNIDPPMPGQPPCSSAYVPHPPSKSTKEVSVPITGFGSPPPLPGLRNFGLFELKDAANNFSEENKIGSSDFGTVYKGVLPDGRMVAIKVYKDPPQFLVWQLSNKLRIASKLQSKDMEASGNNSKYIINVLGYGHKLISESIETHHMFLVEEYLPKGKMDNIIYGPHLNWSSRFQIIQGLVRGLHFLHEENIVHTNVKPANALLDSDMNPKITDFGIARILEKSMIHDNNIAGTVGYMPPEYILEGILSTKHDVYSFGISLLETISGMSKAEPARHHASVAWAWNVRDHQQMGNLFGPSFFDETQLAEIKRCLEIGLLCTQFDPAERPTVAQVLGMLNGEIGSTTPKQPEYTKGRVKPAKRASRMVRSRR